MQLGATTLLCGRISCWLFFVFLFAAILESGSAAILRFPYLVRFVWNPNLEQARKSWNAQTWQVDEEIGGVRVAGPKSNSEFPVNEPSCGSAYGDSFVSGAEVADGEGWVEQLSHLIGCRVNNYAVGNYGVDQAYLRFRRINDQSTLVLLGINPNTIMDNVNQYDGFLAPASTGPAALKGRFLLDASDHLEWQPRPHLDADGFIGMLRHPAKTLPHSYFLPDTPDGPVSLHFPYTVKLLRVALMPRLRNLLARRASYSSLYDADHRSAALPLMTAIIREFVDLAKARDKRALVVILPGSSSFREQANYGAFEYAPLVAALAAKGVNVFDPGAAMIEALNGRSACEFFTHARAELTWFTSPVPCWGHYSTFGNSTLAHLVAAELRHRNYFIK